MEWQTERRPTRSTTSQREVEDISVILTVHLLESRTRGLMYLPGNKVYSTESITAQLAINYQLIIFILIDYDLL